MPEDFGVQAAEAAERLRRVLSAATQRAEAMRREAAVESDRELARANADVSERLSQQLVQLREMRDQVSLGSDALQRALAEFSGKLYALAAEETADPAVRTAAAAAAPAVAAAAPAAAPAFSQEPLGVGHRHGPLVPALGVAAAGILLVGTLFSVLSDLDDAGLLSSTEPTGPRAERATPPAQTEGAAPAAAGSIRPGGEPRSEGPKPAAVGGSGGESEGRRGREEEAETTLAVVRDAGATAAETPQPLARPADTAVPAEVTEPVSPEGDPGEVEGNSDGEDPASPTPQGPPEPPARPDTEPPDTPAPAVPVEQPGGELPVGIPEPGPTPESDDDLDDDDLDDGVSDYGSDDEDDEGEDG